MVPLSESYPFQAILDPIEPTEGSFGENSVACVSICLRSANDDVEVLFIKRSENPNDPWSGQIAFPGGKKEEQDQDNLSAAMRECEEEVGIDLTKDAKFIGCLKPLQARIKMKVISLTLVPFVFWLDESVEAGRSDEVSRSFWYPMSQLLDTSTFQRFDYSALDGNTYRMPYFDLNGEKLWGLTLRVTHDLLLRIVNDPAAFSQFAAVKTSPSDFPRELQYE
jgi:8-oxo-dGTP pyrophosphatase MutT (NUDIX family)